jgi:hypothetical protein
MNIKKLLKVVDKGWIRKPKGFRVHFQKMVDARLITEYLPDPDDAPFQSDVVAWRSAWKLWQATKNGNDEIKEGDIVNIYVIDDAGNPVKYYVTHQFKVYRQVDS